MLTFIAVATAAHAGARPAARLGLPVAAWPAAHPEIEVACRDRARAYAEAIAAGAPQALDVADRWHLFRSLAEAVDKVDLGARPMDPFAGLVRGWAGRCQTRSSRSTATSRSPWKTASSRCSSNCGVTPSPSGR
ncbi:transposase [Spirillospora sp. CA-255316]